MALQQAGEKLARDMLVTGYDAFRDIIYFCIELMRQFYDDPRSYRINRSNGKGEYVTFSKDDLENGYHRAEFDISVSAEKNNPCLLYTSETLKSAGAVSEETALEMSKGALEKSGADIAVSITGIAGPEGGTDEKPVGLVYISVCTEDFHKAYKFNLTGERGMVRERAALYALDLRCV